MTDDLDFIYDTEVELSGPVGCLFIDDTLVEHIDYSKSYVLEVDDGIELTIKFTRVALASETEPCVAHFEVQ